MATAHACGQSARMVDGCGRTAENTDGVWGMGTECECGICGYTDGTQENGRPSNGPSSESSGIAFSNVVPWMTPRIKNETS